jgi:hypothetical protein
MNPRMEDANRNCVSLLFFIFRGGLGLLA